ncbi:MAG: hypothetical protein GX772_02500 [Alcaligenaceae bacterium]|nr:hypothetical protein [Alcaligenaceae bacterium]
MEIRRTPFALAITAALSLGMLAACSDESDQAADAPVEKVTPAPDTAPMESVPATPSAPGTTPPPVEPSTPPSGATPEAGDPLNPVPEASQSSTEPGLTEKLAASGQALQESATEAAHAAGEKAGELRDATGERMSQMGQAIRDGAARADEAIQESIGQGGGSATSNASESRSN